MALHTETNEYIGRKKIKDHYSKILAHIFSMSILKHGLLLYVMFLQFLFNVGLPGSAMPSSVSSFTFSRSPTNQIVVLFLHSSQNIVCKHKEIQFPYIFQIDTFLIVSSQQCRDMDIEV